MQKINFINYLKNLKNVIGVLFCGDGDDDVFIISLNPKFISIA